MEKVGGGLLSNPLPQRFLSDPIPATANTSQLTHPRHHRVPATSTTQPRATSPIPLHE